MCVFFVIFLYLSSRLKAVKVLRFSLSASFPVGKRISWYFGRRGEVKNKKFPIVFKRIRKNNKKIKDKTGIFTQSQFLTRLILLFSVTPKIISVDI